MDNTGAAPTGYTLKLQTDGQPTYPSLDPVGAPAPGLWWSTDPKQALCFCRKIDAHRFMDTFAAAAAHACQVVPIPVVGQ